MIAASDLVALDLETTGLNPHEAALRLVQVSNGNETYVIDAWSDDVRVEELFEALARKTVIAHNAKFEWSWVYHLYGIELEDVRDTYLMAKVLAAGDMSAEASLEALADTELGISLDKEMQVSNWAAEDLEQRQVDYAALDAQVLLPLHAKLTGYLAEEGLERVAALENDALPVVARMNLEGMPVDKGAWDAHAAEIEQEMKALERRMIEADWMPARAPVPQQWKLIEDECREMLVAAGVEGVTGTTAKDLKDHQDHEVVAALLAYRGAKGKERELLKRKVYELAPEKAPAPAPPWNLDSPQQVREICHELTGEWFENTDEATLLEWIDEHPFFSLLLEHRKLKKRSSTYGPGWFKDAYDEDSLGYGRVFPGWRQIGTSTGRFACSAPNAQNLPNDGPYRSFFVAPAGRTFVDVDYSQIEVRIIAKVLDEPVLLNLFRRGADLYRSTAAELLGIEDGEVTGEQRKLAKALVLGMLYGLSAYGLPTYAFKNYGIKMTSAEAENHVRTFYDLYPRLEAYHDAMRKELNTTGYVDQITLAGRRRDGITNRNEAINAPIQGAAADALKMAMAEVHRRLRKFNGAAFIIAAIHDELLVECDEADGDEVLEIVQEAMVSTMHALVNEHEPHVPITVEGLVTKVWSKD
jgi:DNA polymerase I